MPVTKRKAGSCIQPDPVDENGKIIGSQTSIASRKRRRAGMSMAECGYDNPDGKVEDFDYRPTFHKESIIHYSWGMTMNQPIVADKRKRRGPALLRKLPSQRGLSLKYNKDKTPEPVIPNGPKRSHLLRMPLEIRERIYRFLLIHKNPILLNHDWHRVEHKSPQDHSVLKVCKQITEEASTFLYRNNCFQSFIRASSPRKSADIYITKDKYLPLIKNAVIEHKSTNWGLVWFEKTYRCVETLVKAGPRLNCLTLVVEPQRVLITTTATGDRENSPITFADFLSTRAKLMKIIRQVKCKVFNVIVRKPGVGRFLISVDMRALEFMGVENSNGEEGSGATKRARRRVEEVRRELMGLKTRFEEVFEEGERAAFNGMCRSMGPEESVMDGLALTREKSAR